MESIVPRGPVDILVVAAHGPDIRGLRNHLGERLDGQVRGLHVTGKTVGVGLSAAGPSAAKRVFQLHPKAVIHLGTCGIYPGLPEYRPHDVIVADRIRLLDHSVTRGDSQFSEPMQTELKTSQVMTAGIAALGARIHQAAIASPLSKTIDDHLAAEVPKRHGCHGENLEAFSIAHACHLAEIPFTSVLGATHVVGSNAHDDWQKFERQTTISVADVVVNWILTGAQGLPHG